VAAAVAADRMVRGMTPCRGLKAGKIEQIRMRLRGHESPQAPQTALDLNEMCRFRASSFRPVPVLPCPQNSLPTRFATTPASLGAWSGKSRSPQWSQKRCHL